MIVLGARELQMTLMTHERDAPLESRAPAMSDLPALLASEAPSPQTLTRNML